jgi:hypothetical protein
VQIQENNSGTGYQSVSSFQSAVKLLLARNYRTEAYINETPRRSIMVTSSSYEISTDQLGNRVGVERCYSARNSWLLDRYLKTT